MNIPERLATLRLHAEADAHVANYKKRPDFNPPCKAGCYWCCSEFLSAHSHEVELILESLTPEQIEELKPRVKEWLERAMPHLQMPFDDKIGLEWRKLNLPCPFLKNGQCSVYEHRPLGCRTFFAFKDPERCKLPEREHQLFAEYPHPSAFDCSLAKFLINVRRTQVDHLGVLLANKLFGLDITSAMTENTNLSDYPIAELQMRQLAAEVDDLLKV